MSHIASSLFPILTLFWTGVFLRSFCIQDEEGGEGMRCSDGALRHYKPRGLAWQFRKNHMGLQMGDQPTIMINQAIVFGKWRSSTGFRGTPSNCLLGQTHMTRACPWRTCNWVQCQVRYLGQKPTQLSQQAVDTSVRHGAFASALLRLRDAMSPDAHSFELPPPKCENAAVQQNYLRKSQKQVHWQDSWFLSSFFHISIHVYTFLTKTRNPRHPDLVMACASGHCAGGAGQRKSHFERRPVERRHGGHGGVHETRLGTARGCLPPTSSNNVGYFNGISHIYIYYYF